GRGRAAAGRAGSPGLPLLQRHARQHRRHPERCMSHLADEERADSDGGSSSPTLSGQHRYTGLRRYNIIAAVVHAAQAIAVVLLATDFTLPMTGSYLGGPPGSPPGEAVTLWDVPIPLAIAAFLVLSSLFHVIVASPPFFNRYRAGLAQGHNYFRW